MMPPFVVFPTNRIAHFVEVSLYLFYLAQQVNLNFFRLSLLSKCAIMNQQVATKGIQLVTISRPTAYGEYAPYTFIESEKEFEDLVQKMAVEG